MRYSHDSGFTGLNVATGISTCACSALLCAGIGAVVSSFTDVRAVLVQDADMADGVLNQTKAMKVSEADDRSFHDTEAGDGLLSYTPLKFQSSQIRLLLPEGRRVGGLQPPPRTEAQAVIIELAMRSRNGTMSRFALNPLPLAYDETVHARTPAPERKCRSEQGGTWMNRQCHLVKRLNAICVQVYHDEAGAWHLHSKMAPPLPDHIPVPSFQRHTFGCDVASDWHPAEYSTDRCWGPQHGQGDCLSQQSEDQIIHVTVRSARDPFIRAGELVGSNLDFGMSKGMQRAYGFTMLVLGVCLGLVPVVRLYLACRPTIRSKWADSDEDTRKFSYGDEDGLSNIGAATAGVYGHTPA
eukprot:CAMPEP_0177214390 /NCGR_PEP_ID=MMETSP0367-20130122/33667_1 /TAXON_ID=447022 ORGANISM="Scrippsiella hangoei-like, Strain SHHI-4" /NCGR_SAMPLE_ID=MMETSP0367 /ASSEMBLY_ACC=CAM_ASM_000362 /LENGTH=353 /DNA_ID=CAMNT_0018663773 /DNA_START=1 /DNA_END=1063 /DNA_ORIENTATION=+